jgi:hypothetical protein
MQIILQVFSQSPVIFWFRHEVHYYVIWMCAEASAVLRAVAEDLFFNCWY